MAIITQTAEPTLIETISERQALLNITDEQISEAMGFERSGTLTLMKQCKMKIPVQSTKALAAALGMDPVHLFRKHLAENLPEVLAMIDELMPGPLTNNEVKLIEAYRHLSRGREVVPVVMDGNSVIALITV